jgi:antitoxin PrlF
MNERDVATATARSNGWITVPRELRERLALSEGDRGDFVTITSGMIVLRPARVDARVLKGVVATPARPRTTSP